jgi:hypothetical protein
VEKNEGNPIAADFVQLEMPWLQKPQTKKPKNGNLGVEN